MTLLLLISCVDYQVSRNREYETWVQPARDQGLDVLWVLDNSASMYEEQVQLASHTQAFADGLSRVDIDLRLGVMSTDAEAEQDPVWISGSAQVLAEEFSSAILNQGLGSREERGFDAALWAVSELRTGADVELLFFSDEDDQSDASGQTLVEQYSAAAGELGVNAIVGDPPQGCASLVAAADPAPLYLQAVELTQGSRASICALDYDSMLSRMALHVLGLEDRFALAELPELDSMEVMLDEDLVPRDPDNGWSYDAGSNLLVLNGDYVPFPGQVLQASYFEWYGAWDDRRDQEEE
ncbi:MAG: hypothetical protein ACI9VR_001012 [Cognaticolwellia sp.]